MDHFYLIAAFLCAVGLSAICSLFESVLYSVSDARVEELAESGRRSGRVLRRLRKNIEHPIAAILILNTIANTAGASVAGAFFDHIYGSAWLGVFTGVFTFCILIFSEIIPKTIGVTYSHSIASWIAFPIQLLVWLLTPLVWMTGLITQMISRGGKQARTHQGDIEILATMALKAGEIDPLEQQVIRNILALDRKVVRHVLTPRSVVLSVPEGESISKAHEISRDWPFSRVLVFRDRPDQIVGLVLRRSVFKELAANQEKVTFGELMLPIHTVKESDRLHVVFHEFLQRRQHLFAVVDEFASFSGVISLEDILEEIIGREIVDEMDEVVDLQAAARKLKPFTATEEPGEFDQN